MRATRIAGVAVVMAGLIACGNDMDGEADAIDPPDRAAPSTATPERDQPVATPRFEAMGDGHMTGIVRLYEDSGDGFLLEVVLDGLPEGEHAWHIHEGACDAGGPVVVAMTSTSDMQGIGGPLVVEGDQPVRGDVTVSELSLQEVLEGGYSLHIHESGGTDHGPSIACADLSGDDNATM